MKIMSNYRLLPSVAALTVAMNAFGADSLSTTNYSPHVDNNFPSAVFFGDTHVHIDNCMDAGAFGNNLGVGVEPPKDVPTAQQDRAYTSPIWYTPAKL